MLSILLLLPVVGALLVALLPARFAAGMHRLALAASLATLCYATYILASFDTGQAALQFAESYTWNPRLGTRFSFGVDGISMPLVMLAAMLSMVAILASVNVRQGARLYFMLLLLLETAVMGVFMARDWSLFYVFWELCLIPVFFLIDRLGGENRQRAALNFVLYTMGGSVFMLIALLFMYDAAPGHSFDMAAMAAGARSLPANTQMLIFLGLLVGFGVKMPIFLLHGWVRLAYVESPSFVPIVLSGVMAKMGSYGLVRAAESLPSAIMAASDWLAALAFISMLYGGVLAWRQRDLKAMVAYSSMSHMGVVLLGIATLNVAGLNGAVTQMVAHGLVAGALFLLVGLLYERTGSRDIAGYTSLSSTMPRFAFFTVLAFVAAVGLPGTAGFVAELHAMVGGFARWGYWVVLLSLSVLVAAAFSLRTVGRLITSNGQVGGQVSLAGLSDMNRAELAAATVLASGVLVLGFYPAPLLNLVSTSVHQLAALFGG